VAASAQTSSANQGGPQIDPALRFRVPTVTVTAQKESEDKQKVPVSVTAVPKDVIDGAGIHVISDAAIFAPNTYFTEFSRDGDTPPGLKLRGGHAAVAPAGEKPRRDPVCDNPPALHSDLSGD
jgi:outer membrane receptor protein involved in Fe transport